MHLLQMFQARVLLNKSPINYDGKTCPCNNLGWAKGKNMGAIIRLGSNILDEMGFTQN